MDFYVREWTSFLKQSDALAGIPLALAGLTLMFGGWRIWKAAVVLTFGILGAIVGVLIGDSPEQEKLYGAIGFLVAAGASFPPVFHAVALLGGIIGAALTNWLAAGLGLDGTVLWLVTATGMITSSALAFINLRQVIMVVTAFEGAALLLSAVVAVLSKVPGPFNYFRAMAFDSSIFLPFLVAVPTMIGILLQAAHANQKGFAITRD